MSERWHLSPDSGAMKGNNPYQLNRTTIDQRFRSCGTNPDDIQGYSATGEIIYKSVTQVSEPEPKPEPKPETSCSTAYKALEAARKPTTTVAAANQLPDSSPFFVDNVPVQEQETEGFTSRRRAHHHHHHRPVRPQAELQRLTQESYDRIMGRY